MEPNSNNPAAEGAEQVPAPAPDAQQPGQDAVVEAPAGIPEARLPTKKDTSLREFLGKMDDYAPIVCCPIHHPPTPSPPPPPSLPSFTTTELTFQTRSPTR